LKQYLVQRQSRLTVHKIVGCDIWTLKQRVRRRLKRAEAKFVKTRSKKQFTSP